MRPAKFEELQIGMKVFTYYYTNYNHITKWIKNEITDIKDNYIYFKNKKSFGVCHKNQVPECIRIDDGVINLLEDTNNEFIDDIKAN